MTGRTHLRRLRGILALAIIAVGYLGLPAIDGATRHAAEGPRADLAHVDDGTDASGHRCLLPEAYPTAAPSLAAAAPAPAGLVGARDSRPANEPPTPRAPLTPPARAPPHA